MRSNRTFMELKSTFKISEQGTNNGSNRTFMELKFGRNDELGVRN